MSAAALPWHRAAWDQAHAAVARGAHALLIAGAQGLGKSKFAEEFSAARLCANSGTGQGACGHCESCHWLSAGTHPDYIVVEPIVDDDGESPRAGGAGRSKPISVDQIRGMSESLGLTAHRTAGKVVLIRPAEALNVAASNALLKSLEEPPSRVLFLLVSDRPSWLLPTVRSRCQKVDVNLRDPQLALSWLVAQKSAHPELTLALSGGAPLLAMAIGADAAWQRRADLLRSLLDVDADALRIAERYRDVAPALVLGWLQRLTYDIASCALCGPIRYHIDLQSDIERCIHRADAVRITRLHRKFVSAQRIANHPLNPRLFLEQLCIEFTAALTIQTEPQRA